MNGDTCGETTAGHEPGLEYGCLGSDTRWLFFCPFLAPRRAMPKRKQPLGGAGELKIGPLAPSEEGADRSAVGMAAPRVGRPATLTKSRVRRRSSSPCQGKASASPV